MLEFFENWCKLVQIGAKIFSKPVQNSANWCKVLFMNYQILQKNVVLGCRIDQNMLHSSDGSQSSDEYGIITLS
jgi:hypothetical protein